MNDLPYIGFVVGVGMVYFSLKWWFMFAPNAWLRRHRPGWYRKDRHRDQS